jgi:endo-1,4-beta-D-glucanase Y
MSHHSPLIARHGRRTLLRGGILAVASVAAPGLARAQAESGWRPQPWMPERAAPQDSHQEVGRREWNAFKARFMTPDGRIVDTGNGGCTHTEGQGLGMLFAVAFDDPTAFDGLLLWTARHLRRPYDTLHGWRYQPGNVTPVQDWNNATDGDLFIAAALKRAALKWGRPDHLASATAMARDILRLLVRRAGDRTVLLPGAEGFETASCVAVNPSYYIFPVLEELAELAPSPEWDALRHDGVTLTAEGRFGEWRLPPDWLRVDKRDGTLSPHPNWPARFSYDAIRVPLYLAWGRLSRVGACEAFSSWAEAHPVQPAWVDLRTNAMAGYAASPGMVAIARVATAMQRSPRNTESAPAFPAIRTSPDYYSAALVMLSRLAWQESHIV